MTGPALSIGSLFAGIGGLELGLERAGLGTVAWQVESDPLCRRVLARHWPNATRYPDVRTFDPADAERVDLICGGFPCQDLSDAGVNHDRPGLAGPRSGLWFEMLRIIERAQPRWVVAENVDGGAWKRWVPVVRSGLHGAGYASVPLRVPASIVGAPFRGSRIFVVAQAHGEGESARAVHAQMAELPSAARARRTDWGQPPPGALGVANGVPDRMDRLRAAGNAVVPAAAEAVGRLVAAC